MSANLTLVTIVAMAIVTYMTRVLGFLMLRGRKLSPMAQEVLTAAPGCVLIAVLAPKFASGHPADLIVLVLTIFLARRLPLIVVVLFAVFSSVVLRFLLEAG